MLFSSATNVFSPKISTVAFDPDNLTKANMMTADVIIVNTESSCDPVLLKSLELEEKLMLALTSSDLVQCEIAAKSPDSKKVYFDDKSPKKRKKDSVYEENMKFGVI